MSQTTKLYLQLKTFPVTLNSLLIPSLIPGFLSNPALCIFGICQPQAKNGNSTLPINWWKDKLGMIYTNNEISFTHKNEWTTDTCYNMDEL